VVAASAAVFAAAPPSSNAPTGFWSSLATTLHVSRSTLLNDVNSVKTEQLSRYAQAHHWSAAKLSAAEKRLARTHWVVAPARRVRFGVMTRLRGIVIRTTAKTLNMTPAAVRSALKSGTTLSAMAQSHSVSSAALQQDLATAVDAKIAAVAKNRNLSAARVQKLESHAASAIQRLMTRTFGAHNPTGG
jgi:hypothetical protein